MAGVVEACLDNFPDANTQQREAADALLHGQDFQRIFGKA